VPPGTRVSTVRAKPSAPPAPSKNVTAKKASAKKRSRTSAPASRFDAGYFDHYYGDPRTRVQGPAEVGALARAIAALADFWHLPLDSALDLGAGVGLWKKALRKERPDLEYRGVDLSPVACARYGHEQRDIARWRADERFDLIVCQGVLQYLDDRDAAAALRNIAAMARGLLYLEALTKQDVEEVVDLDRTDADVHLRTGSWYRTRLSRDFVELGCGLFSARRAHGVFFELEHAP
jgi:predicted TPR repeat methyltransferase